jgi:hypothetical protein
MSKDTNKLSRDHNTRLSTSQQWLIALIYFATELIE